MEMEVEMMILLYIEIIETNVELAFFIKQSTSKVVLASERTILLMATALPPT